MRMSGRKEQYLQELEMISLNPTVSMQWVDLVRKLHQLQANRKERILLPQGLSPRDCGCNQNLKTEKVILLP